MKQRLLFALVLLCAVAVQAQDVRFSAQLRERSEFNMKSHTPGSNPDVYHLLRTRLRADAMLNDDLSIAFEIQDSRMFGIEESTLNTGIPTTGFTTGFDVRNAFLKVSDIVGSGIDAKLGRMSLDYGNSRFIGSREPYNVTQSFNGLVVHRDIGPVELDGFVMSLHDMQFAPPGITLTSYIRDGSCGGLWAELPNTGPIGVQAFFIHDTPILNEPVLSEDPVRAVFEDVRQKRHTGGVRVLADIGPVALDAEGALQGGTLPGDDVIGRPDRDIAAHFYALALSLPIPGTDIFSLTAGYEYRTGDERPNGNTGDSFEMFSTLHGNVYRYHGFMNYFQGQYAFSTTLQNNGLQEFYVRLDAAVSSATVLHGRFHLYSDAVDPAETFGAVVPFSSAIGMEADFWVNVKFTKNISLAGGIMMFDADADRAAALGIKRTTHWSYLLWLFTI